MQELYLSRALQNHIQKRLNHNPAVILLGARQVGKSTLAQHLLKKYKNSLYLDLEKPSDRQKIESDPELFLKLNKDRLICLDEIQFLPEIFQTLRSHIDENKRNNQFLLLGSASRDLIHQSSETLAGRAAYIEITPFMFFEIDQIATLTDHWLKGGYPRSFLQHDLEESINWRKDYIKTFLERDIPKLGFSIPSVTVERLWRILAHSHCQLLNLSNIGKALGVSHHTVRFYIDILEQTFLVKTLKPYTANIKKRLIKTPKLYIRDTGLLHALLDIEEMNDLLGHPVIGFSFESYVVENITARYPKWNCSFYRDSSGNEVDFILEKGKKLIAIEIKASTTPKLEKGFWNTCGFLKPDKSFVVSLVEKPFPGPQGTIITNLSDFLENFESYTDRV